MTLGDGTVLVESALLLGHPTAQLEPPRPMQPPPGLTKADVSNLIELYGNEEGGQARFAVYVGKPGPKAWCPVKDLAEARRKAGDMNSAQSVRRRRCAALAPPLPPPSQPWHPP